MRVVFSQLQDHDWLRRVYEVDQKSFKEIAQEVGCSVGSVGYALRDAGIQVRGRYPGRWKPKTCQRCGQTFTPGGPAQKFCAKKECQYGTLVCKGCGKTFSSQHQTKEKDARGYCSRKCWGDHNAARRQAKGDGSGYWLRFVGKDVPGAYSNGYMMEHRWVMQEALGRPLTEDETVHHLNGDKADNRLENLELRGSYHGKGQTAYCACCGSTDIRFR